MGVRLRFPILMRETVLTKTPIRGVAIRDTEDGSFHAESIWLPFGGHDVKQVMGMTVFSADQGISRQGTSRSLNG